MSVDDSRGLTDRVLAASSASRPLSIQGGNTKAFYGRQPAGEPLITSNHRGIVDYEPTELVITARSGTLLAEIESVLAEHQQMLAFEPPRFGQQATLGGTIACGFSGPRRPFAGSARDFVLGVRMVNGRGEDLRFGGRVMKNVAGYDVSRLMVGAMGTLGLMLEISLKVLPAPRIERTLVLEVGADKAVDIQNKWSRKPSPISATCQHEGLLHIRLSGSEKGVFSAQQELGGEVMDDDDGFWSALKEHHHEYFNNAGNLWRLSVPPATPDLGLSGACLTEWSGALRWLISDAPGHAIREAASAAGGHAISFRGGSREQTFHPLQGVLLELHENTKKAFDPNGIFNPGRMYENF
jgi:glycolate oxidase FAD binding subunit